MVSSAERRRALSEGTGRACAASLVAATAMSSGRIEGLMSGCVMAERESIYRTRGKQGGRRGALRPGMAPVRIRDPLLYAETAGKARTLRGLLLGSSEFHAQPAR